MTEDEKLFAQMWDWELPELKGHVLTKVYAYTSNPDDNHPEKVIMELKDGGTHSFFMSMGGCWRQMDEDDVLFERENYEGARVVDYTHRFNLNGQVIQRVWCEDKMPMTIQIQLSGGLLTLTGGDWNDPDAAIGTLRFAPAVETSP